MTEQTAQSRFIQIADRRELFLDDYLTEKRQGLDLLLHSPQPAGSIAELNEPWEGCSSLYHTILHDGDRYLFYYRASSLSQEPYQPDIREDEVFIPGDWQNLCLLTSSDGITWEKPELGLVEFNGSKKNNIVMGGKEIHHCFVPCIDPRPECPPEERFKAVDSGWVLGDGQAPGLLIYTSPDGIHWKLDSKKLVITDGRFDSQNVAFYDAVRGYFLCYYRDTKDRHREIKVTKSDDFRNWTTPGQWLNYGIHPQEHLYTNAITPYFRAPHYYVGFPKRFIGQRSANRFTQLGKPHRKGISDSLFMSSRDGIHWKRWKEAFLRPGLDERNWTDRCNSIGFGLVETGPTEMSLYVNRHYTYPTVHMERMTLRTDGFVSLHAGGETGEWLSKPFIMEGTDLELNFSTSAAGSVRFEILDEHGNVFPNFSLEETPMLFGDQVDCSVYHEYQPRMCSEKDNKGPLWHLKGIPIRLRLLMRDADVYAFRFRDDFELAK